MNIATTPMAPPTPAQTAAQQADASQNVITSEAKAANTLRIAELSAGTHETHVAEHIRGMVAATMGQLSINTAAINRENAAHRQQWALGVADGVEQGLPAVV